MGPMCLLLQHGLTWTLCCSLLDTATLCMEQDVVGFKASIQDVVDGVEVSGCSMCKSAIVYTW